MFSAKLLPRPTLSPHPHLAPRRPCECDSAISHGCSGVRIKGAGAVGTDHRVPSGPRCWSREWPGPSARGAEWLEIIAEFLRMEPVGVFIFSIGEILPFTMYLQFLSILVAYRR
ncbi:hypothetical protein TREES_T100001650 [Tupaia chinensis]|uniref:Uncharacterized protein n=1 Tax=Tupaia chinensis TaxID=246437 RepID=L9KJJ0_TUPCH|nr:hypothetical protein TREES_T100001650 [Tupaia chinensis]